MPTGPRPPIPAGVCKVTVGGTTLGHRWVQVFYLQLTHATVTVTDLQGIADEISALWNTNVAPHATTTTILTTVTCVFIPSAGSEVVYEGTYSHAGTNVSAQVQDASACAVVQWKISAYYRGGHPRTYFPGLGVAQVTNGSDIDPAFVTGLVTGWNAFRNALNAFTTTNVSAIVMGTLSFQTANAWRTTPVFRAFTSVAVNPKLGSQRRRIRS